MKFNPYLHNMSILHMTWLYADWKMKENFFIFSNKWKSNIFLVDKEMDSFQFPMTDSKSDVH